MSRSFIRPIGAGLIAAAMLVMPARSDAAPASFGGHSVTSSPVLSLESVRHEVSRMVQHGGLVASGRIATESQPRLATAASQLKIQWPSSAKAIATNGNGSQVLDLGSLNGNGGLTDNPFGQFHNVSYLAAGAQGAWAQQGLFSVSPLDANGNPTDPAATFKALWLGSYYSTAAQARARLTDAESIFTSSGQQASDCSVGAVTCKLADYATLPDGSQPIYQGDPVVVFYVIMTEGNVVGEFLFLPPPGSYTDPETTTFINDVSDMAGAGAVTVDAAANAGSSTGGKPSPSPTPTTPPAHPTPTPKLTATNPPPASPAVHLAGLAIRGASGNTTTLKAGSQYLFVAQAQVANQGSYNPAATISFARNGQVFETDPMTRSSAVSARLLGGHQTSGPSGVSFTLQKSFTHILKNENDSATVNVTLGPVSDSNSESFTVKAVCKKVTVKTKHGKKRVKKCK